MNNISYDRLIDGYYENRNGKPYNEYEKLWITRNKNVITYKNMSNILKRSDDAIGRKLSYWGYGTKKVNNQYILMEDYCLLRILKNELVICESKVDKDDIDILKKYTWNIGNNGYLNARIKWYGKSKCVHLHRYILNIEDSNICCDHYNIDKMDNRKLNLRICTKAQNNQNRADIWRQNKSGYRGVSKSRTISAPWKASVKHNGINFIIEYSSNIEYLAQIARFARAYILPFSSDANEIKQEDIPQWIKDKIDNKLLSKVLEADINE